MPRSHCVWTASTAIQSKLIAPKQGETCMKHKRWPFKSSTYCTSNACPASKKCLAINKGVTET